MNTWISRVAVLMLAAFAVVACHKSVFTPIDSLARETNIARTASTKVCSLCATLSGSSTIDDFLACQKATNETNEKLRAVERALARLGNEDIPSRISDDLKYIEDCLTKGRQAFKNAIDENKNIVENKNEMLRHVLDRLNDTWRRTNELMKALWSR